MSKRNRAEELRPPRGEPKLFQVDELVVSTPERTSQIGTYFTIASPDGKTEFIIGATSVFPIDVTQPNALAEYRAYRDRVGPPPGTVGGPEFLEL